MSAARRPVSILIAALGGQGGGVLTEWIVAAAEHAGLPVQATSIPGVAQRTGATTYYLEVYPEPVPAGEAEPVFSLYPMAGDVDVIMASELLEAGRTLEMDYASPDRTTLIASTHRLFSIGEKSALGNGIFPADLVIEAARALSRRLIACDALAVARTAGSEVNAVLMGALAASGALPLAASDFEAAIREGGVAVERNLTGFKAGMEIAAGASDSEKRPRGRGPTSRRSAPIPSARAGRPSSASWPVSSRSSRSPSIGHWVKRRRASSTIRTAPMPSASSSWSGACAPGTGRPGSPSASRGASRCG